MRVRASGTPKEAPPANKKARGPLWPKTDTSNKKKPNRRGSEPLRPRRAFDPLPSLRQGERARPPEGPPSCEQAQGPLETCEPQNGKNNRPKRSKRLYRLASKKGPQSSPERIQKPHGAQNGTPKKHQNKKDARPKQAIKTKRRGQKKKQQQVRGGCGVLLA